MRITVSSTNQQHKTQKIKKPIRHLNIPTTDEKENDKIEIEKNEDAE